MRKLNLNSNKPFDSNDDSPNSRSKRTAWLLFFNHSYYKLLMQHLRYLYIYMRHSSLLIPLRDHCRLLISYPGETAQGYRPLVRRSAILLYVHFFHCFPFHLPKNCYDPAKKRLGYWVMRGRNSARTRFWLRPWKSIKAYSLAEAEFYQSSLSHRSNQISVLASAAKMNQVPFVFVSVSLKLV